MFCFAGETLVQLLQKESSSASFFFKGQLQNMIIPSIVNFNTTFA
jgi:hypothetical protein